MTISKDMPQQAHKQDLDYARKVLRERGEELLESDLFIPLINLSRELRDLNQRQQDPLDATEVGSLVQEISGDRRGLVRAEYTEEYLRAKGTEHKGAGWSAEKIRQYLGIHARENCEVVPSDEDLVRIADAVIYGVDEADEAEKGVMMCDVEAEEVTWLWDRRIPLGKLTLLEGDPDKGKSVITMDLAARVTTGRGFPNEEHDDWLGQLDNRENLEQLDNLDNVGAGVVVLNAEDGLSDTIKPRLEPAGADVSKVLALPAINPDDTLFGIPRDIPRLERALRGLMRGSSLLTR